MNDKLETGGPGFMAESHYFSFYNPYWLNLHHFLHHKVLHRDTSSPTVFDPDWWQARTEREKDNIQKVVDYYQEKLVEQDLRTSYYMSGFKEWAGQQAENGFNSVPDSFLRHTALLQIFDPIFRKHFWPEINQANREILNRHLDLIRQTETEIVPQLIKWTGTQWQAEKIRVDITFYAKSYRGYAGDRPFTTLDPTHIVMNTTGHEVPGNWVELLFHEGSHHLITASKSFVSQSLAEAAKRLNREVPRSLWHVYLFYFSGKACQRELLANGLPDYELYMIRNQVFQSYIPYLQRYLPPYLDGETSLVAASQRLLSAYYKDQE